jgi:ribonuclease VapC
MSEQGVGDHGTPYLMLVVEASAIVAILTDEPEQKAFVECIARYETKCCSPVALYEATLAYIRKRNVNHSVAEERVRVFLSQCSISIVAVSDKTASIAIAAHARYGKGTGHPAQLNMGDCFAYALAKSQDAPLLFKGDDFALTDIVQA